MPLLPKPTPLRDQLTNHTAVDVGQPKIAARIAVRESLVVEPEQVQNRGVQIVDVHAILDRAEAELIGRAMHVAAADAAASEPRRKTPMIVIATVDLALVCTFLGQLHGRCTTELAAPDDER